MREKFRVDKNVNEAKQIVCIGRSEMRIRKSGAKRKYRRRANQILKQTDIENGDDQDILGYKQELSGWDIA